MTNFLNSVFLITSTIIGLGVFILPYTLAKSGIYYWFWFLIVPVLIFFVHLVYSEIIFQIEEKHNLPGLSARILGRNWKNFVTNSLLAKYPNRIPVEFRKGYL